jgi:hypothetical protein
MNNHAQLLQTYLRYNLYMVKCTNCYLFLQYLVAVLPTHHVTISTVFAMSVPDCTFIFSLKQLII